MLKKGHRLDATQAEVTGTILVPLETQRLAVCGKTGRCTSSSKGTGIYVPVDSGGAMAPPFFVSPFSEKTHTPDAWLLAWYMAASAARR